MADIKYLAGLDIDGNINLNTNQLQFAVIQPDTSDPVSQPPQVGQIYYKSDSQSLRIYTGSEWISVGQDSNNYVTGGSISSGTLTLTREGLGVVEIEGLLQLGTTSTTALAGDTTTISSDQAGAITANSLKVTFPGFGTTAGTALEGDTVIPAAANNGTLTIAGAGIASVGATSTFGADQATDATIIITATEVDTLATVTARGATTGDDLTLQGDVLFEGTIDMNSGTIENLADPSNAQEAATKNYVDSSVSGQLIYQGGYDATTDPPTGTDILKGFTYTVTVAGDGNGFFTIPLEIGDLIIAESDNPAAEGDWTEVNKNVDLATTTTVGVASFSSDNFAVSSTGEVTVKNNGIALGSETVGNYVKTISGGTNVTVSGGTGEGSTPSISVANSSIDGRITNRQYSGLIGDGSLTDVPVTAATHGLGADSTEFMIQLVEVSSGETVFAEVTRGASGLVTVGFTTAPASNSIRILIQKIG
jgi:hypothetical protein